MYYSQLKDPGDLETSFLDSVLTTVPRHTTSYSQTDEVLGDLEVLLRQILHLVEPTHVFWNLLRAAGLLSGGHLTSLHVAEDGPNDLARGPGPVG